MGGELSAETIIKLYQITVAKLESERDEARLWARLLLRERDDTLTKSERMECVTAGWRRRWLWCSDVLTTTLRERDELLKERAAVRKSLGDHFIAIADEHGNETDHAYYMDQGVGVLADQWRFSQDQIEQAIEERDEARRQAASWKHSYWGARNTTLAEAVAACERVAERISTFMADHPASEPDYWLGSMNQAQIIAEQLRERIKAGDTEQENASTSAR